MNGSKAYHVTVDLPKSQRCIRWYDIRRWLQYAVEPDKNRRLSAGNPYRVIIEFDNLSDARDFVIQFHEVLCEV